MSTRSRFSSWIWYAAAPVAAGILATGGIAVASAVSGSAPAPYHSPEPSVVAVGAHQGTPAAYASVAGGPRLPLTADAATSQVTSALSSEQQLVSLTTRSTSSGMEVVVNLTHNDGSVADVWLADLAVGAVCELVHSDQAVASDLVSNATATGPGANGDTVTTSLGVGAVELGEVFNSPSEATLETHVADVASNYGLTVSNLRILHPLESALSVTFTVPSNAKVDWTIDQLRTAVVGSSPDVEGVFIELVDSNGQTLLESGASYRTGEGGLWFAPGQDERFGALHGGIPGG